MFSLTLIGFLSSIKVGGGVLRISGVLLLLIPKTFNKIVIKICIINLCIIFPPYTNITISGFHLKSVTKTSLKQSQKEGERFSNFTN